MSTGMIIMEIEMNTYRRAGLIDHQKTLKALRSIDYDRTITLEVFTNSNDAKSSANKLKTMWAQES